MEFLAAHGDFNEEFGRARLLHHGCRVLVEILRNTSIVNKHDVEWLTIAGLPNDLPAYHQGLIATGPGLHIVIGQGP